MCFSPALIPPLISPILLPPPPPVNHPPPFSAPFPVEKISDFSPMPFSPPIRPKGLAQVFETTFDFPFPPPFFFLRVRQVPKIQESPLGTPPFGVTQPHVRWPFLPLSEAQNLLCTKEISRVSPSSLTSCCSHRSPSQKKVSARVFSTYFSSLLIVRSTTIAPSPPLSLICRFFFWRRRVFPVRCSLS